MRLEEFSVVRSKKVRRLAESARVPLGTISPLLRSLINQWDYEFCLQLVMARFGYPSYRLCFPDKSEAWVWVLASSRPVNVLYIEIWPQNLPAGFFINCRNWNSAVVDLCLWLTRGHFQRQLASSQGGGA